MQQETILFNSATGGFSVLNASAALVWQSLESPQDADVLARQLCEAFSGVSPEQARRDVDAVLEQFRALALVEEQAEPAATPSSHP